MGRPWGPSAEHTWLEGIWGNVGDGVKDTYGLQPALSAQTAKSMPAVGSLHGHWLTPGLGVGSVQDLCSDVVLSVQL